MVELEQMKDNVVKKASDSASLCWFCINAVNFPLLSPLSSVCSVAKPAAHILET